MKVSSALDAPGNSRPFLMMSMLVVAVFFSMASRAIFSPLMPSLQGALNISLATGNIGREGGGCCRLGGHQEGYYRPSDAHVGRPAEYIDQFLINGGGKVYHVWACDHYKTTLNASQFKRMLKKRSDMVKEASQRSMPAASSWSTWTSSTARLARMRM